MTLSKEHADTLEEIVGLDGNCLNAKMCSRCPFASVCLPEFLNARPTKNQRKSMALDVLARHHLIGEEGDPSDQFQLR